MCDFVGSVRNGGLLRVVVRRQDDEEERDGARNNQSEQVGQSWIFVSQNPRKGNMATLSTLKMADGW